MKKTFSRRQFLGVTAAGAASVMAPFGANAARRDDASASPPPSKSAVAAEQENGISDEEKYEEISLLPVYKSVISPHWFSNNTSFWYRNDLAAGRKEFILVDAFHGVRAPAFDHTKLASSLSKATGHVFSGDRLPFNLISFTETAGSVRFDVDGGAYTARLTDYSINKLPDGTPSLIDNSVRKPRRRGADRAESWPGDGPQQSPDGAWTASIYNSNVRVTDRSGANKDLTTDGTSDKPYGSLVWSPNSSVLVGFKTDPVQIQKCNLIESSPAEWSSRGLLRQHEYAQPGDPFSRYEMWLFHPASSSRTQAAVDPIDFGGAPEMSWDADGSRFTYEYMDRGYQRFRIVAVDASSGKSINIVDDKSLTFVDSTNLYTWYSDDAAEVIFASERDGWRHLYLFDGRSGALKNQITRGAWVVRDVDRVDQASRQIWFTASGKNQGEDPYHLHRYRVNFDGSGLIELTGGDGLHNVTYSPDEKYLIDTYSRADLPPVHTLRLVQDGSLLCNLERADIAELTAAGWRSPEVFSAKGRDGVTDIWGFVFRPLAHRPGKKYPIIENIYAGPQDSFVRKSFAVADSMQSLAELGFIVVQIDGMGTRNRSKAFHDVCWHNIKDAGFPDRIAWLTALARKDPSVDLTRVGIYGTSAGGQNSTGALLFHPEFYKVAVSSCGCHDNRIDKQWWNEQWMGYPVGPWFEESSNIANAHRLRGKLLLMVGELDTNVPPESTIRLTDALIKAGKDYELVIITGSDHTDGGAYGERRRRDFFTRHLLGVEPPDRNLPVPPLKPVVLAAQPPSIADTAESSAGSATTIKFNNLTKQPVTLFWVPSAGARTRYATVAPGDTYTQNTYVGHTWLAVGQNGVPIAVFVGAFRPGIANIRQ
jgi:dipeptidyl aminopeptidase/acylaminoacyl peptidase